LASCNPNNPSRPNDNFHYFDGWYNTSGSTVGGVYSDILNYAPWVDPNNGTSVGVSAWAMLTGPGSGDRWAQTGWVAYENGAQYSFAQWTNSAGTGTTTYLARAFPLGQYTYYTTEYNNTPGDFTFNWGGNWTTAPATFVPNEGQVYGEIATEASQMPGGYNYHEDFSNTEWYPSSGWTSFSGTPQSYNLNYWGNHKTSSTDDQIWDWACSS
jgi:hypothetical protein